MVPNIFSYATKELSQDAVICWLVACAKDATGELREVGLDFVHVLMQSGDSKVIDVSTGGIAPMSGPGKIGRVLCGPTTQYQNIDVYFQAEVDGTVVSFVIEDKTHTEMHSDQLKRYLGTVTADPVAEDHIKAVYLKTGHVFDDEREEAESSGYTVFSAEDMVRFLDHPTRTDHEILRQYSEYIESQVESRQTDLEEWNLERSFVQWKFMVALGKTLQMGRKRWSAKWFNKGGGAWTQYPHWDGRGALYWRLDSGKPLRLMVETSKAGDRALARWDAWSGAFETARTEAGLGAARFRSVRIRRGELVREGTIGAVDIADCLRKEGLCSSVARVNCLYRRFIGQVGSELAP